MRSNKSLEQTVIHRGRTVRAVALCARAGDEKWKDIAAMSGPMGLRPIKGFRDAA